MKRVVCLIAFGVALCGLLAGRAWAEEARSLPLTKQSVYNYFRQVEEAKRYLGEDLKPEALEEEECRIYAMTLKHTGYDFEATVRNAVQFGEKGARRLDDPRFLFLAAVFQIHPNVFLKYRYISPETRDAVLAYFGQTASPSSGPTGPQTPPK